MEIRPHCLTRRLYRRLSALENVGRSLLTDIDKPQERMRITSVRYRELVSLRGCERKALEAEATGKLLPSLGNDLAFGFRRVGVFFRKGEMPSSRCLIATRRTIGIAPSGSLGSVNCASSWYWSVASAMSQPNIGRAWRRAPQAARPTVRLTAAETR
jgi:hypothetical protein